MAQAERDPRLHAAWLLWCFNQGYVKAEDRAIMENWLLDDPATLHRDDAALRPHLLAMADELLTAIAVVAGPGHVVDVPVSASEPNPPKARPVMPVSAEGPQEATALSAALAEYERQVADARPQPQPLPAKDFMTDKEAAVFWFAEWERKRDEWLRGWQAAAVLSDAIRDHMNTPHGPEGDHT